MLPPQEQPSIATRGVVLAVGDDVLAAGEPRQQRLCVAHLAVRLAEPPRVVREHDVAVTGVEPRQQLAVPAGAAPAVGGEYGRLWLRDVRFVQRGDDGRLVERLDLDGAGDRHRVVAAVRGVLLDRGEVGVNAREQRRPGRADSSQHVTPGAYVFDW
jgi:hypothetical protein